MSTSSPRSSHEASALELASLANPLGPTLVSPASAITPGPSLTPTPAASKTSLHLPHSPQDVEADPVRPAATRQSSGHSNEEHSYPPDSTSNLISPLPPSDTGYRAWSFLIAATTIETIVWGLPFSVGILHVYWTNVLFKGEGESVITLAATLQTGLMYMSAGVLGPFTRRLQILGLVVSTSALIGTAFVTQPWHLILSFGCLYPFAGAMYLPCAMLLFEWFHSRRGLATGIMYAGTGAGGTIIPFLMSGLLNRFGYRAAMVSLGVSYAILGSISLMFIRRRVPLTSRNVDDGGRRRAVDWSVFGRKTFIAGILTILATSLGNFIPSLWLPSFADSLNVSPSGVGLIALMNGRSEMDSLMKAASVPGNALMGLLTDLLPVHHVIIISCLGSALSCLLLWGFGVSTGPLVTFALFFGLLGLSFSGVWSKMISTICGEDPASINLVFSIFATMRGVGNITSGPISDALLRIDALKGAAGAYGHNNYGILLVYTGVSIFAGCLTGIPFRT